MKQINSKIRNPKTTVPSAEFVANTLEWAPKTNILWTVGHMKLADSSF